VVGAGGQALGELAGTAADFQDRGAGAESGGGGDELHDAGRVAGAGVLVPFGDVVEQGALVMAFVPVSRGFRPDGHCPTLTRDDAVADQAFGGGDYRA